MKAQRILLQILQNLNIKTVVLNKSTYVNYISQMEQRKMKEIQINTTRSTACTSYMVVQVYLIGLVEVNISVQKLCVNIFVLCKCMLCHCPKTVQ